MSWIKKNWCGLSNLQEDYSEVQSRPNIMSEADYDHLRHIGAHFWAVGSRTIAGAGKLNSDYDFLVLTRTRMPEEYGNIGYKTHDEDSHYDPSEGQFNSWRKGLTNLIATDDVEFCRRFLLANSIAQSLRLLDRADRVTLFQAILYHNRPDQ